MTKAQDNIQANKQADTKDFNKKVQAAKQLINSVSSNPDQGKKQQKKQDNIKQIKQPQQNKPELKNIERQ